jgi:hypothetical protein
MLYLYFLYLLPLFFLISALLVFGAVIVRMVRGDRVLTYQETVDRAVAAANAAGRFGYGFSAIDREGIGGMPFSFFRSWYGGAVRNVMSTTCSGHPVRVFDFTYFTSADHADAAQVRTCGVVTLPLSCPWLRVTHQRSHSLQHVHESPTVELESEDFNLSYCVQTPQTRFAYELIDGRMMEFLLANAGFEVVEVCSSFALVVGKEAMPPSVWPDVVAWLDEFCTHIPNVVSVMHGWR